MRSGLHWGRSSWGKTRRRRSFRIIMVAQFDVNGDGVIDFEEFLVMIDMFGCASLQLPLVYLLA